MSSSLLKMFSFAKTVISRGQDKAFFVFNPAAVRQAIETWKLNLPTVTPFYALKANDHPMVLDTIRESIVNIDCASKREMERTAKHMGTLENCIYSHPCKDINHLLFARDNGLTLTVVDSVEEVHKIRDVFPEARFLCRIAVSNEYSRVLLGNKFGCSREKLEAIIEAASGMNLCGVSFHVGSACNEPSGFQNALEQAHEACATMKDRGVTANIVNLGGGYTTQLFEGMSTHIRQCLQPDIIYMAEPGRLFVETSFSLFMKITSKRQLVDDIMEYTVNDGLYGALNNIVYDKFPAQLYPFCTKEGGDHFEEGEHVARFWGPSCDGLDIITPAPISFVNMEVGDWVYVPNAGAYINPGAEFNGFPKADYYNLATDS